MCGPGYEIIAPDCYDYDYYHLRSSAKLDHIFIDLVVVRLEMKKDKIYIYRPWFHINMESFVDIF